MLHPVRPSCEGALSWAVELQKDILEGLCDSSMSSTDVTISWARSLRPDVADWVERFVNLKHRTYKIINHMKVIAGLSASDKQTILTYFHETLNFSTAFLDGANHPTIRQINDFPASASVLGLLEAFYEKALREISLPVDQDGNYGSEFDRDDYVRIHGEANFPRVCPLCDSPMKRAEVEHWLGKAKYPALSCHPRNLIPSCHDCNALEKSTTPPLDINSAEPFTNWFHPYERQAVGKVRILVVASSARLESIDTLDAVRAQNLDTLLGLSTLWSKECTPQKQRFQRELRKRFRRQTLSMPALQEEIQLLKEIASEEHKTVEPYALLQTAILERVLAFQDELSSWLDEVQAAIT
ncbi:hypothetical protein [Halomicronema sp. CCY15110]|uniref:hypothetical protein n=1 Tax=Halomicronema sp. CCY15110 TaxID=2767773 RepID=UPI00194E9FBF|nr:hypothetical protein [Halomicronema sp. CCY15110]